MYAIIDEAGKQYKVTSGDTIDIDREDRPDQTTITFDRVLFVGGEGEPRIGTPTVAGATVTAEVIGPVRGKKIEVVKYKRRKGYHKHTGHRQSYLRVRIAAVNVQAAGPDPAAAEA
jgi:large subunit ribosomal protein L21